MTILKTDLNGTKGTHYDNLEIMAPTTQEENPTVNGVTARNIVSINNPSYNLISGGVILEDNPSYNKMTFYTKPLTAISYVHACSCHHHH